MTNYKRLYQTRLRTALRNPLSLLRRYWRGGAWNKFIVIFCSVLALWLGSSYVVARWYIASNDDKPLILGSSFIPAYAESLGLEPQETMQALIDDVGVRHFRLVSYWNQLEPTEGQYDFSQLDWQFQKAEKANAKISLSLGLRQPRWPECHMPDWAAGKTPDQWQQNLNAYISAVVKRYKNSPALHSYQLENEFFLTGFGNCEFIPGAINRQRLVDEYALVKQLDSKHRIIVSRSQNAFGVSYNEPRPDVVGISIYKRVWGSPPGRYVEYPFPAWYFASIAGWQKLFTGRDTIIHELQAEAWAPNFKGITDISLEEQNKSFDAKRFVDRVEYGRATGMREMYLWSGEYWYYRKVKLGDNTMWDAASRAFDHAEQR
jgi:hypothetical protein